MAYELKSNEEAISIWNPGDDSNQFSYRHHHIPMEKFYVYGSGKISVDPLVAAEELLKRIRGTRVVIGTFCPNCDRGQTIRVEHGFLANVVGRLIVRGIEASVVNDDLKIGN